MKRLVDAREPITMRDVQTAQRDACKLLATQALNPANFTTQTADLVARLLAIVDDSYGRPVRPLLGLDRATLERLAAAGDEDAEAEWAHREGRTP